MEWSTLVLSLGSSNHYRLFCYFLLVLWMSKNKVVNEHKVQFGTEISRFIQQFFCDICLSKECTNNVIELLDV